MSGNNKRLNCFLDELVTITFKDGSEKTGVLEFGMGKLAEHKPPIMRYSLYVFGEGYRYLRIGSLKRVKLWNNQRLTEPQIIITGARRKAT